jgi:pimeloyl-ACP methyl ester carboxylesterase
MPYSTTNGVKIYYEVSGEGLPFVMVHANPFDHNLWMYQIAHFSTYFKVIAVDIRGYGRSDKPTTPFTLKEMADDVLGVCRDEGLKKQSSAACRLWNGAVADLDRPRCSKFDPGRR